MSLLSSLFLHSSKPPTAAGFLWGGGGLGSGVKVDGRTGTQRILSVKCREEETIPAENDQLTQICRVLTVGQEVSE